jgi:hypothetical protein
VLIVMPLQVGYSSKRWQRSCAVYSYTKQLPIYL